MKALKRVLRIVLFALAFLLMSCATITRPDGTERAVRFDPPNIYHSWWEEMEDCAGERRSYYQVKWWLVPNPFLVEDVIGQVHPADRLDTIYLTARVLYAKGVVQHEMLHAVLRDPTHPVPPFGKCAPMSAVFQ